MQSNLTKGSIKKNLILFSLPYLLSCFLQTFYGMADLFFIGQYNDSIEVTAVTNGSQIMHMVTVIIVGLAMGSTVLIGQYTGANNNKAANQMIGNSFSFFILLSIVCSIITILTVNPIIKVMSIPSESVSSAQAYLIICFLGIPFITCYNIISCIMRGMGDSKSPLYFVAIACTANIILDFILIGICGLGAMGAAVATVSSQFLSVLVAAVVLFAKNKNLKLCKNDFKLSKTSVFKMLSIGIPVSLQDGLIQVSFIVISIIANKRGPAIAASIGTVEKIISFLFLIPSAMLSSISAIASINIGAGEKDRARKTLHYGIIFSVTCGMIFAIICQFASEQILSIFSHDDEVIRMGADYLRSYSFDCAIAAIHFCFSGFFFACGKSIISFIHNITSIVVIRIPGAYFASKLFPDTLFEMGLAAPLGSLLSALICVIIYRIYRKNQVI